MPVKAKGPLSIFVPITNRDQLVAKVVYRGPLQAPVEEGTQIGALKVWIGDTLSQETPVYAADRSARARSTSARSSAIEELMVGWMR